MVTFAEIQLKYYASQSLCEQAVGQIVQRGGKRQRVRPLEAGLQGLFAAAIGKGPGAVAAPYHQGLAPGAEKRIPFAHHASGAGARDTQDAAQALGAALFRQGPERGGNRQRHRAGRQGAQDHQAAAIQPDQHAGRVGGPGGGRQAQGQGKTKPWSEPPFMPLDGTHVLLSPRTRRKGRIIVESTRYRQVTIRHRDCG